MKKILALLLVGLIWMNSSSVLGGVPTLNDPVQPANEKTYTIPGLNDGETVAAFNKELYNFTQNTIRENGKVIFQAFEVTETKRVVAIRFNGTIRAWVIWEDYNARRFEHKGNYILFDKDCNGTYETKISTNHKFIYPDCYKK